MTAYMSQGDVTGTDLLNVLRSQDKFFGPAGLGPQYDYPNPRGYIPAISLRTHLHPVQLNLLGKDQFFGAAGQPPANLDWPVPKGYQFPISNRGFTWSTNINTLVTFPKCFAMTDWPNPRGYVPAISLKTHLDPLKLTLLGKDQFFGAPGEGPTYAWPNPAGPRYPTHLGTFYQAPSLSNLLAPAPFNMADWPNPSRRTTTPINLTFTGRNPNLYRSTGIQVGLIPMGELLDMGLVPVMDATMGFVF